MKNIKISSFILAVTLIILLCGCAKKDSTPDYVNNWTSKVSKSEYYYNLEINDSSLVTVSYFERGEKQWEHSGTEKVTEKDGKQTIEFSINIDELTLNYKYNMTAAKDKLTLTYVKSDKGEHLFNTAELDNNGKISFSVQKQTEK